jgi:hypothetical protein
MSFGQACGVYRIKYIGSITSVEKNIVKIGLPTTLYLHGIEDISSKSSFIYTPLTNGFFDIKIHSHLTTPYNNINQLLASYKRKFNNLKMKVIYIENDIINEALFDIEWKDINISIINDNNFGTLFEFRIKKQII